MTEPLIVANKLKKYFPVRSGIFLTIKGYVKAVDGVNISINRGETLGVVGESGCGKSTLGRTILRLIEPSSGEIYFDGINIMKLSKQELYKLRRRMQIVFQNPLSSLDPRFTVLEIVSEPLKIHKAILKEKLKCRVVELLRNVGLSEEHLYRYPHELSGGQRQRVGIARALALNPEFLVLDEPTSSLDVSVQAQILNLFKDLQEKFNLTYMFISHNLSVIKYMAHSIAVMYLGKVVEKALTNELYKSPLHPYTQVLLSSVLEPAVRQGRERVIIRGEPVSPLNLPPGCRFSSRCPRVSEICGSKEPELTQVTKDHYVACHKA